MPLTQDFFSLFFPKVCFSCGTSLYKNENNICTICIYHLPKTGYHLQKNNPVERLFWGRTEVQFAASYLFFTKGEKVQKLIHQFKYEGKKEIGITLGKLYGTELLPVGFFDSVDIIVPVPLHKNKQKKRGYNQAAVFAEGLADKLKKPLAMHIIDRSMVSDTQTKKSRFSRWKNVEGVFYITNAEEIRNKHILLVDDVVTTGSTLEACTNKILEHKGTRVSVATIAFTGL